METALFLEINIFSLLVLLWMQFKMMTSADRQVINIIFSDLVHLLICITITESCMAICDGVPGGAAFFLHNVLRILTSFLAVLISVLWFLFTVSEGKGRTQFWIVRRRYLLLLLPVALDALLQLSSPFTHLIFRIDRATNRCEPGSLLVLHVAIIFGFFIAGFLRKQRILIGAWRNRDNSGDLLHMEQIFILFPLASCILYVFCPQLPNLWPSLSLSLLMVFIDTQQQQISLDALTGLNNRRCFDLFIRNSLSQRQEGWLIFLFIIDIDLFKRINDTFGHVEGDAALVLVADTLRAACARRDHNIFLARTGGDEFIIVLKATDPRSAAGLKQKIHAAFAALNRKSDKPYNLGVSIGYAQAEDWMSEPDLVKAADKNLYDEKRLHHQVDAARL